MEVILQERMRNLGNLGDTIKVKPGFARNYLLPTGKAIVANAKNLELFAARKAELEKQAELKLAAAKKQADQLSGLALEIKAKARDDGKLFGSVGPAEIVAAVAAHDKEINKSEVKLPQGSLREVGEYKVEIHLHNGEVVVPIDVAVVSA